MTPRRETPLTPEAIEPEMCPIDTRLNILSKVPFIASLSRSKFDTQTPRRSTSAIIKEATPQIFSYLLNILGQGVRQIGNLSYISPIY